MTILRHNIIPQRRLSRAIAGVAASALALLAVAVGAQLWSEREASLERADQLAASLARSWEDSAIGTVDLIAFSLDEAAATARGGRDAPLAIVAAGSAAIRALAIVGPLGVVSASTESDLVARRILPPGMMTTLRRGRPGAIEIGPPTPGRFAMTPDSTLDTQWHITVARGVFDDQGGFIGAVAAIINPAVLANQAAALDVGAAGEAMLLRYDGLPMIRGRTARAPAPELAEDPRVRPALVALRDQSWGSLRVAEPEAVTAWRSTSFFPIIAIVVIDANEWLAPWRERALRYGLVTAAITAIAGLLFVLLALETRVADEAAEREHLLGAAIENTTSPVLITDAHGAIIWVNNAFTELCGYSLDDVAGRNPRLLKSGLTREAIYVDMWRKLAAGESWRGDFTNRAKDGSLFEVEQTITPVKDERGAIRYHVSIQTDVTREKAAERALIKAKSEADEATRAKSQFLANMSHELRTPLNAVIGFSQMMRNQVFGPLGDRHYETYVADIEGAAEHLLGLISDLLDLSRIEVGKMELREEMKRPRDAFEACRHILSPKALSAGVTIDNALPADAPLLWIDLLRIRQVMINLVYNSLKFTPRGGIVRVSGRETGDGGYELSVSDNGAGIPESEIKRVLDPFVSRSLTRHEGEDHGTGLGLHLARALMRAHGGDLMIESEEGRGTIVHLIFPPDRVVDPDSPEGVAAIQDEASSDDGASSAPSSSITGVR